MKLRSLGEDAVVAALTRALPLAPDVRHGAGDDCAVVGGPRARWWQLLKTDAVLEGVHFLPQEKPARVGWKALCRAISDIAAMGGTPQHALITLALHPECELAWARALYTGLRKAASRFGVSIVGGETTRSPGPTFLSIALTGRVQRTRCTLRSGAKKGDALYVTGTLGGSITGKHLDFIPRLAEARWLVENIRPSAMMDLSDGLASDLPRLAAASHCSYTLNEASIPKTKGSTLLAALTDGEDYELLFTIPPRARAKLERDWPRQFPKLTHIGTMQNATQAGKPPPHPHHGHDHFA